MGRVVTRDEIVTRCREMAGQENVGLSANRLFVSSTEINAMVDAAMRDLYDLLVAARGHEYYAKTSTLGAATTVGGQYGHDLPTDWYQTLAVRARFSGDSTIYDVAPYAPGEAAGLRNDQTNGGARELRYRHGGSYATDADPTHRDRLLVTPTPTTSVTVEVDYIPTYLTVTSGAVSYNGIQGWEDYAVYSVVAHILAKEESDPGYWLQQKAETAARIRNLAGSRDAGRPQYIQCREPIDSRGASRGWRRGWLP